jgi:alpha-L-fucosidase
MVSGRVFNYQGDFTVMGDNEVPQFAIDEPWQTPASVFSDTWGYRSWQDRNNLSGKVQENILRLVQVVSRGGNFILNIGPQGDGSIVPYEADVLKGIGSWVAIHKEAIYGTGPQPFRQLDFGYATTKPRTLYLFVKDLPVDGQLHLPGLKTRLQHACVLGDSQCEALPIAQDAAGATVTIDSKNDALQRVKTRYPESASFLPVIAVTFRGPLQVQPQTVAPQTDGSIHHTPPQADHLMNYNGRGYEAPSTLYKLRWNVAARPGTYRITLKYRARPQETAAVAMVNGQSIAVTLAAASQANAVATPQELTLAKVVTVGKQAYTTIELTPPQPFYKGTPLQADIEQIILIPVSEGR